MKSFIRRALVVAAALAASALARAQTPPAAMPATNGIGPRITFNTENYDFGKIQTGDPVKYVFMATNTGDETLEISNAKGSCTCTVVGEGTGSSKGVWTAQKVEPGQSCRIPIEIATANYRGQTITKFVTVTSNDKARSIVNLQIHGSVWLPIEVSNVMASFNLPSDTATNTTQVLKIFNRTDAPLALSDPASSTNIFSAALKTNIPGQEFELTVTAAPPSKLPPSFGTTVIQGLISLKTSAATMNPLQISVFETIYPEITVYPPAGIQLPAGPLAQASTNHITIRGNSEDLKLSDPSANVPGVDISVNVIQTNRQYYLSVVFPKGFEIQPGQNISLAVKTDNPRFPVLSVPVTPMVGVIISNRTSVSVPPPARTSVLPPSILANAQTNSGSAPAPNQPMRLNPPHP